jgi:hypothetical protein
MKGILHEGDAAGDATENQRCPPELEQEPHEEPTAQAQQQRQQHDPIRSIVVPRLLDHLRQPLEPGQLFQPRLQRR